MFATQRDCGNTVPYRTQPFRDLPFPRFGLKKTCQRSQKPYRLPNCSKTTSFSVSVFNREPYRLSCSVFSLKSVPFLDFLQKARTGTARFAIKIENGKRFCFCYGSVRAFFHKTENGLVLATVRFAV